MDAFRNLLRGWVGKALLALIILPFAIVGIEGVFTGGGPNNPAIEIDGHEISKAELDQAVETRRQQLLERMGEGVDPSLVTAEMVRPATEKALIQRQLLINAAEKEGLYVPAETVKSYVRSLPQFHDDSGVFSQQRLETFLAQAGLSAARIFNEVSADMVTEQLQNGLTQSAFATPSDVERILDLDRQTRDIGIAYVKPDTYKASITLSEEDLQKYFDQHSDEFRSEEKVQLEYLRFSKNDFVDSDATVTDDQIAARIAEKTEKAKQNERRRAAHILIESGNKHSDEEAKSIAEDIAAELKAGKSFEELAKAKSEDFATAKNGGDLGFASKGVYDPAFESALYALTAVNEVSGVVKSEFGYHVIKLLGIDTPSLPDAVRDRESVVAELREEQAKERMVLAVDELNRLAFESGDLTVIADQYKKPVETSGWITRSSADGFFNETKVKDVAFSDAIIQEQRNSDAIELEDGSLLLVKLKAHEPPRQLTLEEVKERVNQSALAEKAREKAATVAGEFIAKTQSGMSPEEAAKALALTWETHAAVERTAGKPNRQVIQKAFELPKPEQGKVSSDKLELANGDIAVLAVSNIGARVVDRTEAEKQQFAKGMAYRFGNMEMEGYLAALEAKAEIKKSQGDETK